MELKELFSCSAPGEIRAVGTWAGEAACLLSDGSVWVLDCGTGMDAMMFDTSDAVNYDDGGFNMHAPSAVYKTDGYTAVVNSHGLHGFLHAWDEEWRMKLHRDGYQAAYTEFPLALFRNEKGVPMMIFADAWNHLQIADLSTRRVLTAAKSRVTEGAEERHIAYYSEHEELNKLLWPSEYDYFYGKIHVSPDCRHFLSCGWVWGSFDAFAVYETEDFITNPRIRESVVFVGEHLSREACFFGNDAVAVPVKPDIDDYGYDGGEEIPWEVRLYDLDGAELAAVPVPGLNLAKAALCCLNGLLCIWSGEFGFAAVDFESGEVVFRDAEFCPAAFDEKNGWFVTAEDGVVGFWEMG